MPHSFLRTRRRSGADPRVRGRSPDRLGLETRYSGHPEEADRGVDRGLGSPPHRNYVALGWWAAAGKFPTTSSEFVFTNEAAVLPATRD
jgi:hypothetical protein